MSARKTNERDLLIAYTAGTVATITAGWVGGLVWHEWSGAPVNYGLTIGVTWLTAVGIPSVAGSSWAIKQALGQRERPTITAAGQAGRAVPINYSTGTVHTFLNALPGRRSDPPAPAPILPDRFTVHNLTLPGSDAPVTIELPENTVMAFMSVAWGRQGEGRPPFSRPYWTERRRPRLDRDEYYAILTLLLAHRLIVNRRPGKSGRLALQPRTAMRHLKYSYGLTC